MELKFNIVYTTGTVRYLRLLVFSLLRWSDCSFRLVANACSSKEVRLLQELSRKSPRLEFLALPSERMMKHGKVLTYLQSLERSDYFCFMDSDILAAGDFAGELSPYLDHYAGVFSAPPIWCPEDAQILPETLPIMAGNFNRTSSGVCIGTTYFAMYDNTVLTEFVQSTGIAFETYKWPNIPAPYQSQIMQMGLKKRAYDTGKLLNVLLAAQGRRLLFVDLPSLHHVGGVSVRTKMERGVFLRMKLQARTWRPVVQVRRWMKRLTRSKHSGQQQSAAAKARIRSFRATRARKVPAALYFNQLFQSLFENKPLPVIPGVGDPGIEQRIESAAANIVSLYEEFGEQLA
jgi:hypothetical protein